MAVAGAPRATFDLDIFVDPTRANAQRLARVLKDFGYEELARIAPHYFSRVKQMAAIGRKPLQVDFLTSIDGVTFGSAWRSRIEGNVDGANIPFLGFEALLKNKQSTGRPKDRSDVRTLKRLASQRQRLRGGRQPKNK